MRMGCISLYGIQDFLRIGQIRFLKLLSLLGRYGNRSLKKYQTLLISKKMKLKKYSKKIYRFLVIADIISVLFLFLYLCYLKNE